MRSSREIDDLDRAIIVALQQDGRAAWKSIAEQLDAAPATVVRRGQQLLQDGVVRVAVIPARGSDGPSETFFLWLTCSAGRQLAVAGLMATRPDSRYVSMVTGDADLLVELSVPRGTSLADPILEIQTIPGVERLRTDPLLKVYKIAHDWGRPVHNDSEGPEPGLVPECQPTHFDRTDWQIIDRLRQDGRASLREVARVCGLNATLVQRRFDRLRSNGCVSIVTLVQAAALGLESETMVTIKVSAARINEVAAQLAAHRHVRYLAAMLAPHQLICEVICTSMQALYEFITVTLGTLDGVESWDAHVEILTLKRSALLTPWWRDGVPGRMLEPVLGEQGSNTPA